NKTVARPFYGLPRHRAAHNWLAMFANEFRKGHSMKTARYASAAILALATFGATAAYAQSRDTIQVAGSSTVLPFASIVAEEFSAVFPEFQTPVVGSGGTGGGLTQFCAGVGDNTIDIANASRAIKDSE